MSDDFRHSTHAEQQRTLKAVALELQLRRDGIPAAAARTLPPKARRRVEAAAGVRRSSDETWERTFLMMEDAESARRTPS